MNHLYEQVLAGIKQPRSLFEKDFTLEELLRELQRRHGKVPKSLSGTGTNPKDVEYDFDYKKTAASKGAFGKQPGRYDLEINGTKIVTNAEEEIVDKWLRVYGRASKEDRKKLYGF